MRTKFHIACASCLLAAFGLLAPACARAPQAAEPAAPAPAATVGDPAAPAGVERSVAQLRSSDFATRTRAARALVAAGESALPALGRAGTAPVVVAGGMQVSSTRSVIDAILAESEPSGLESALGTPWPVVRSAAAAEMGRRDRWDAIPVLIARLDDDDPEVRAASGSALRRLTNNFFGFRAQANLGRRRQAAGRWRAWWANEGRTQARERAARLGDAADSAGR